MRVVSRWLLPLFFTICTICVLLVLALVSGFAHAESELQTFYVQGFSMTLAFAAIFFIACAIVSAGFVAVGPWRRGLIWAWRCLARYSSTSLVRYSLISFGSVAVLLFLLNAAGVLTGTFLIDDYEMYSIAVQKSVLELVWMPINDHVIPLFWIELKGLFSLSGTRTPLLNFPLFAAATLAIGAGAVLMRQLKFGIGTLLVLLAIFASTTVVSHQLYGFYAVAPYFQVLATFMLSLVFFTLARQQARFSGLYLTLSLVLVVISVLLESGGVWAPFALAFFAVAYRLEEEGRTSITSVLAAARKEISVLSVSLLVTVSYIAYLMAIPYFSDAAFYGPDRLPLSFSTIYELYKVCTAGVLSSFIAPRFGLIISQPRFEHALILWNAAMFFLFVGTAAVAWWAYMRGTVRTRIWGSYFLLLSLGTSLLIAIARPSSHAVSFYRDQNILFPLFFIAIFFAIASYEWVRTAQGAGKALRIHIVIALCSLVFASQLVFSFYKEQYLGDISFNRSLIAQMHQSLVPALNELSATKAPLVVPSIGGTFLGSSIYQLPDLSEFSFFLGIKNVQWIPPGQNASTTSPTFADALRHDARLRQWYLALGEIGETCSEKGLDTSISSSIPKRIETARADRLIFDITVQEAPEKIFLSVAFENAFAATGTRATIRLDQYTKQVEGAVRRYVCTVKLNDIPAYALSPLIKNLVLTIETVGTYHINSIRLLQNGETLPGDMQ
jgi:hypothetical protein